MQSASHLQTELDFGEEKETYIGKPMKRKEDYTLLQGGGQFLDDGKIPDSAHVAIFRSTYAHARIVKVDKSRALALDGVLGVIDHADLDGKYTPPEFGTEDIRGAQLRPLAKDKVRYVGEPVVAVVARDRYVAEDALDLIDVEYEPLMAVVDPEGAITTDNLIHEEWGTNVAIHFKHDSGNTEDVFSKADHVFEESLKMHRHTGTPIETRGITAHYEPTRERITVWSTTHMPHIYRVALAGTLNLNENKIRVISGNIGGSYGTKSVPNHEDILLPLLSLIFKIPVKWVETRMESFKAVPQAREQTHHIKLAVDKEGKILGIMDRIVADLGAMANRTGPIEAFNSVSFVPGCYAIDNYAFELLGVVTNRTPLGPYRGFGKSAPNFMIERMVDIVSKKLGIDVAEIRSRNLVDEFPYENAAGAVYDSGSYKEALGKALKELDYEGLRRYQSERRKLNEFIGIGISASVDPSGHCVKGGAISAYDAVTIRIGRQGKVTVLTGACGFIGTAHETVFSQVVGEVLGVLPEDVEVIEADTYATPVGQGSFSDRTSVYTMSAAKIAADKLKAKILKIASVELEVEAGGLDTHNGMVFHRTDQKKRLSIKDIAHLVFTRTYSLPEDIEAGLEATHYFSMRNLKFFPGEKGTMFYPCFGNSCH
ncbi:MAG: xanthine dehydrogenase family protein molybdopterin-binding subunit, partial [Nitrososphaerales archaeon]